MSTAIQHNQTSSTVRSRKSDTCFTSTRLHSNLRPALYFTLRRSATTLLYAPALYFTFTPTRFYFDVLPRPTLSPFSSSKQLASQKLKVVTIGAASPVLCLRLWKLTWDSKPVQPCAPSRSKVLPHRCRKHHWQRILPLTMGPLEDLDHTPS
jgi:hypothetical protein